MKIEQFGGSRAFYVERRDALQAILDHADRSDGRPCPGCHMRCEQCGSITCLCHCSSDCAQAPRALSSDPERFPIEEGVVPLVYALNHLDLGVPCWSCEGHAGPDAARDRLPQVWFYVRHLVYPDILARYLADLHFRKLIRHPWKIAVVSADNAVDTTFAIVPDVARGEHNLGWLRDDIRVIGRSMTKDMPDLARACLDDVEAHLKSAVG